MGKETEEKVNPCLECEDRNLSVCCGAELIMGDICSDCKEHSSPCRDEPKECPKN